MQTEKVTALRTQVVTSDRPYRGSDQGLEVGLDRGRATSGTPHYELALSARLQRADRKGHCVEDIGSDIGPALQEFGLGTGGWG